MTLHYQPSLQKFRQAVKKKMTPKPLEVETYQDLVWPSHPYFERLYKGVIGVYVASTLYAMGSLLPPYAAAAFAAAGGLAAYKLYLTQNPRNTGEKKSSKCEKL
ncbi:MAG: hypothetical protein GXN92_03255 [Candidatus Micrarchaeota archaeon]|nr:hypothetical protein [Candidatus Micrarchaeota archaeon]